MKLTEVLTEGQPLLADIGAKLQSVGLCAYAVAAFLKVWSTGHVLLLLRCNLASIQEPLPADEELRLMQACTWLRS
jgi:hypothetical protein